MEGSPGDSVRPLALVSPFPASRRYDMLFLSRKPGEKVVIGHDITVTVVAVTGNRVRVSIDAPDQVCILRAELLGCPDEPAGSDGLAEPGSGCGGEKVRPPR